MQPIRPKCFFVALIAAWVVAIFLPSFIVAAAGLSPLAAGRNLAAATIEVADEVAPAAKIGFALLLAILVARLRDRPLGKPLRSRPRRNLPLQRGPRRPRLPSG